MKFIAREARKLKQNSELWAGLKAMGLTRAIGVSSYNATHLEVRAAERPRKGCVCARACVLHLRRSTVTLADHVVRLRAPPQALTGEKPAPNQCSISLKRHGDATIAYCRKNSVVYEAFGAISRLAVLKIPHPPSSRPVATPVEVEGGAAAAAV